MYSLWPLPLYFPFLAQQLSHRLSKIDLKAFEAIHAHWPPQSKPSSHLLRMPEKASLAICPQPPCFLLPHRAVRVICLKLFPSFPLHFEKALKSSELHTWPLPTCTVSADRLHAPVPNTSASFQFPLPVSESLVMLSYLLRIHGSSFPEKDIQIFLGL